MSAQVTRIAIGRLHNLGNYEHIRYDITVDLTNGENPGLIIHRLERLLGALAPIKADWEYNRAKEILADPERQKDEPARNLEIYQQRVTKHEKAVARRERALILFGALGGASEFTDAKLKWEDDDYWDDNDY